MSDVDDREDEVWPSEEPPRWHVHLARGAVEGALAGAAAGAVTVWAFHASVPALLVLAGALVAGAALGAGERVGDALAHNGPRAAGAFLAPAVALAPLLAAASLQARTLPIETLARLGPTSVGVLAGFVPVLGGALAMISVAARGQSSRLLRALVAVGLPSLPFCGVAFGCVRAGLGADALWGAVAVATFVFVLAAARRFLPWPGPIAEP